MPAPTRRKVCDGWARRSEKHTRAGQELTFEDCQEKISYGPWDDELYIASADGLYPGDQHLHGIRLI